LALRNLKEGGRKKVKEMGGEGIRRREGGRSEGGKEEVSRRG